MTTCENCQAQYEGEMCPNCSPAQAEDTMTETDAMGPETTSGEETTDEMDAA